MTNENNSWVAHPLNTAMDAALSTVALNILFVPDSQMTFGHGLVYGMFSGVINAVSFPFFLKLKQRFPSFAVPIYFTSSTIPWVVSAYLLTKTDPKGFNLGYAYAIAMTHIFFIGSNAKILEE
jgi:hypothetical protein